MSLITASSFWTSMYKFGGEHWVSLTMLVPIRSALFNCISVVPRVAPAIEAGFAHFAARMHFAAGIRELHGLVDQPLRSTRTEVFGLSITCVLVEPRVIRSRSPWPFAQTTNKSASKRSAASTSTVAGLPSMTCSCIS